MESGLLIMENREWGERVSDVPILSGNDVRASLPAPLGATSVLMRCCQEFANSGSYNTTGLLFRITKLVSTRQLVSSPRLYELSTNVSLVGSLASSLQARYMLARAHQECRS